MNRTLFSLDFTETNVPKWPCPKCVAGHLTLLPDSLVLRETHESEKERDHEAWDPGWIRYVFSCLFICSDQTCQEVISCCGEGKVAYSASFDEYNGLDESLINWFTPKYFYPPLVMMDIPKDCPTEVRSHLVESFALFYADPGAALNSARAVLEAVLTNLGIKRFKLEKGKRRLVNLHQRIELLPAKLDDIKDLLIAIKWLGNAGSHDGVVPTSGDVRNAYDLIEYALSEIYDANGNKLKKLAKKVNMKKGPLK